MTRPRTMPDGIEEGEIVTEIVNGQIFLHGVGLNPEGEHVSYVAPHSLAVSQRERVVKLARRHVLDPVVVLRAHHPTGRIYAIYDRKNLK